MPLNWPVIVNFHEAKAFASWKTMGEDQVSEIATTGIVHAIVIVVAIANTRSGEKNLFVFHINMHQYTWKPLRYDWCLVPGTKKPSNKKKCP